MSSFTWRRDGVRNDQDERPACASCRKRKLGCSRDVPACQNCLRTGTGCTYDPKGKPGLKTGAVETLSRRVALLERLLLDDQGTPLVDFSRNPHLPQTPNHNEDSSATEGIRPVGSQLHEPYDDQRHAGTTMPHAECSHHCEMRNETSDITGIESMRSMRQALPSRKILTQVVIYSCISIHHWMPFFHKTKFQAAMQQEDIDLQMVPLLHALVAVVLPRLESHSLGASRDYIHRQVSTSRCLAFQYAMTNASLQSLQVLLILVFEQLNDGRILETCPLIALLVRTVDFLQLTTEPAASKSQVLMKPVEILEPASNWAELEARRRLFWCIFLLDRYTSVQTGWNTSLTSEDVHRRLPADGRYFAREVAVHCPFFGIWNKAHANIRSSLLAHVPAQYREESPPRGTVDLDSTASTSGTGIDSSKLGAFAYCIEAVESHNQVTTFFLQQRIDWQNRQHLLDWLTRFKELDLRLIHWKMFLPPRWKDSDVSTDTSRIDMDPNLTLAHLTHNTSTILLHYPVAFPPEKWSQVVQLPSACSAETCAAAAKEISRITEKFLQHTSIPFVNPQFSFCVFVATKLLLVASHKMKQPLLPDVSTLIDSLWIISARWLQLPFSSGHSARAACIACKAATDLAGSYARQIEKLQHILLQDESYDFDFFDHSGACLTQRASSLSVSVPSTPNTNSRGPSASSSRAGNTLTSPPTRRLSRHATNNRSRVAISKASPLVNRRKARSHRQFQTSLSFQGALPELERSFASHEHAPTFIQTANDASGGYAAEYTGQQAIQQQLPLSQNAPIDHYTHRPDWPHDALLDLSDTLMQPQFLEQDRVITFDDVDFGMEGMD